MSRVLEAMSRHARRHPEACALDTVEGLVSYAQLTQSVESLAGQLRQRGLHSFALLADNGRAWAMADLAAIAAGARCVPVPPFFSTQQALHALRDAGVQALLADPKWSVPGMLASAPSELLTLDASGIQMRVLMLPPMRASQVPAATQKITYTSGTTGQPKGVCLALEQMEAVALCLAQASGAVSGHRHLSVLPLSTLLENLGGLYAPLMAGATAILRPMNDVGLKGAAALDAPRLLAALRDARANSAILVPQMLQALVETIEAGAQQPHELRFIAVGGAPVSAHLLQRAAAAGLPVFEGYGLSECASVVALNTPQSQRLGSVGRPLPHVRLDFAPDGEILVEGNAFLGYAGADPLQAGEYVATGDYGRLDADGYLWLTGRKKNMFITAFGRNVAPEWVERELCLQPAIAQAAVFGEARPWNAAVIVPRPGASSDAIDAALHAVNAELPDYARVTRWLPADQPFSPANDQLTSNGRLRRSKILERYGADLESLYQEMTA